MQSAKESLKDATSSAKKNAKTLEAKAEEHALKATTRSAEGKKIIEQQRKAKEAEAEMELHDAKARHAEETLTARSTHHLTGHHPPAATYESHHHSNGGAGVGYVNVDPSMTTTGEPLHGGHYPPGAVGNPMSSGATDPMYPAGGHVPPTAGHTRRHF